MPENQSTEKKLTDIDEDVHPDFDTEEYEIAEMYEQNGEEFAAAFG